MVLRSKLSPGRSVWARLAISVIAVPDARKIFEPLILLAKTLILLKGSGSSALMLCQPFGSITGC